MVALGVGGRWRPALSGYSSCWRVRRASVRPQRGHSGGAGGSNDIESPIARATEGKDWKRCQGGVAASQLGGSCVNAACGKPHAPNGVVNDRASEKNSLQQVASP